VATDQLKEWQKFYRLALFELDPTKLPERIEEACEAIQKYMNVAHPNSNGDERQALTDALANLRVLRREIGPPPNNTSEAFE
jgi:hypothetical protein